MKEENNLDKLVSFIRKEVDNIKKYEESFLDYASTLEEVKKDFAKKSLQEDVSDEDIVNFSLRYYTKRGVYLNDIKILYNSVISYYKSLVLLGGKSLLTSEESKLLEDVNSKVEKVKFVIDEQGNLVERVKGYLQGLKDGIRDSGKLDLILERIRAEYSN